MNFYTSTYDLNNPTTTQVNVPTNTDYRVGFKFRKNGEIQNLNPNNVTLGTLSADVEKTNGYITFTMSAGDDASSRQLGVVVDKNYDGLGPDEASNLQSKLTNALSQFNISTSSTVLAPYVGKTIFATNVKLEYSLDGQLWKDIDDSFSMLNFYIKEGQSAYPYIFRYQEHKWLDTEGAATIEDAKRVDSIVLKDTYSIYNMAVAGNKFPSSCPDFSGNLSASNPLYIRARFLFGDGEIHQTVKLNINVVKSQKGDLNPTPTEFQTVNYAGTDGDGNAFSYDIVIK